jgi:hypothetical protein
MLINSLCTKLVFSQNEKNMAKGKRAPTSICNLLLFRDRLSSIFHGAILSGHVLGKVTILHCQICSYLSWAVLVIFH